MAVGSHAFSGDTYMSANMYPAQEYLNGGWLTLAVGIHICQPTCIQCSYIKWWLSHTLAAGYMSADTYPAQKY